MLKYEKYRKTIDYFHELLLVVQEGSTAIKLSEDKWSLREILGHLIDSAANNHQRFVRLQFGDSLDFPAYAGEEWVRVQKYNTVDWKLLVTLWYSYNYLLLNVIENIAPDALHNVWIKEEKALPLEQMINDYYKHLELHREHFIKRQEEELGV
jgi:hypothetical protein